MKQFITQRILPLGAILFVGLGLAACAKKSSSDNSRIEAARGNGTFAPIGGNTGTGNVFQQNCTNNASQYARLVSQNGSNFQAVFRDFLQTDIGDLDGTGSSTSTGVDLQLKLKVNNGQISGAESGLTLWVVDSVAAQDSSQEIKVQYYGASQVQGNANGDFSLVFTDKIGQVFVQGRTVNGAVTAQVAYQNSGGQRQSLGSFSQNSCSVWY